MHCEELLPLIEKLADGEATVAEKARAEAHLEQCDACRQHLDFLKALPVAARRTPLPEPPGAYWEALPHKVMARIEEQRAAKPSGGWISGVLDMWNLRWLGALAAGVIAVVVGLQVLMLRQESASPASTESPKLSAPPTRPAVGQDKERRDADSAPLPSRDEIQFPEVDDVEEDGERLVAAEGASEGVPKSVGAPAVPVEERERPSREGLFRELEGPSSEPLPTPQEKRAVVPEPPAPSRVVAGTAAGERFEMQAERPEPRLAAAAPSEENLAEELKQESQPTAPGEARETVPSALSVADERLQSGRLRMAAADRRDPLETYQLLEGRYGRRSVVGARETKELDKEYTASTAADIEAERDAWRGFLAEFPQSDQAIDARYRLAVCSISLYDLRQTEDDRRQAVEDGTSFLDASPAGERAEEIRRELARIER